MDKWKNSELNKMKVGGNQKAREFFESQPDYKFNWSITEKYNSKAAALLRDKVSYFLSDLMPSLFCNFSCNFFFFCLLKQTKIFTKIK